MRVGIISASFPPDFGWDGSSTRAYELAMGLKAAGHEVEIIALAAEIESETIQDGMRVHRVLVNQELVKLNVVPKTTPNALTIWSSRSALWKACLKAHAQRPFDVLDCCRRFQVFFRSSCDFSSTNLFMTKRALVLNPLSLLIASS